MAYEEIIGWSNQDGRPAWQKDALRRIAISGQVVDDDLEYFRQVIGKETGLADGDVSPVTPLSIEHLSGAATDAPRTILGALGPVRRIDRLASDQPPIRFAKHGITLVYGANASGKSGYCRIAKQLCRSQSPKDLKGNIYDHAPDELPEVDIVFGVEGKEPGRQEATWRLGDTSPQELARISVFDTDTARVYVDKDRKVEFLPYELDLLNKLALAAKFLDNDYGAQELALDTAIKTPLPFGYNEGTSVSAVLAKLTPETTQSELPNEAALRALAAWNEGKEDELKQIFGKILKDPAVQLREHKVAKQELENTKADLVGLIALLDDVGVGNLVGKNAEMVTLTEVAKAAALGLGEGQPISGIGSEAWHQMLRYARDFAGEAFSDREEPRLITGETCVLCQQALADDASARMAEFDRYISGRASTESAKAKMSYDTLAGQILTLRFKTAKQARELLAAYSGMSEEREALSGQITEAFSVLGSRLEAIKAMINFGVFHGIDGLDSINVEFIDKIDTELKGLQTQIDSFEGAGDDSERMKKLLTDKAELEDSKKLGQEIEVVVKRLEQLAERLKIKVARRHCASAPISRQITVRRRALLTTSLKSRLIDELKLLGLSHIPIDLSDRSAGSDSFIEIALTSQQRIKNNSDVLSEGEQRALALSCFLAELNEVGAEHGIIVDDPVSSLDHSRMAAVAKRLAAEAASGRQVIIFTHNITFHYMVENEARRSGVPCHAEWMSSKGGTKFGIIDGSGKPSHAKKTKERIANLLEAKAKIFKDGYDPSRAEFRDPLAAFYTLMRETWERIVEEVLFNSTIQRFRPEIMTQSLRSACYDPAEDYPAIFEGMKRCSHHSGHDRAADLPIEFPSKEDIDADLEALIVFHRKVSDRKAALEKTPKYEEGFEPEFL